MQNRKSNLLLTGWLICIVLLKSVGTGAQQPPAKTNQAFLPIVPIILEYEFAPQYFMQWINEHPQYSMISAIVGKSEPPLYQVILNERESGQQIYYANSEAKVKALKHEGKEAHFAKIDLKVNKTVGQEPSYGFGFRDKHGQPILWRFVLAGRPSSRGSGVTALPAVQGLRLMNRNQGTAAGEGTAVQIGDKVIEAQPWKEISAPPYFVAYRGSYTEGMHIGSLPVGSESWRVVSAPSELREGAEWTLVGSKGVERRLKVTAHRADEFTVSEVGAKPPGSAILSLNARATPQGVALRSIVLTSDSQVMRITFTPELDMTMNAAGKADVSFQIAEGANAKVSQGTVSVERQADALHLRWQPSAPDWAKSRTLNSTIKKSANGYTVEVSQPSPQAKQ